MIRLDLVSKVKRVRLRHSGGLKPSQGEGKRAGFLLWLQTFKIPFLCTHRSGVIRRGWGATLALLLVTLTWGG